MKSLADEMSYAGKLLDDEEMMSYILAGLDDDYEPVVSNLVGKAEAVSVAEIYSQHLSFEGRAKLRQQASGSSVNSAKRGGKSGDGFNSNFVETRFRQ
uniref:Retrotransposon protein, putative, Ty1-copia subclass n=1 Tax=Oryza sativa subsp. japonica TaxID=39947 RepID=Q2QPT6_ORYSJ|nr:retrotransposon protein, putative, Ty1-copia subclass [Oryza sativa Japonica Group]